MKRSCYALTWLLGCLLCALWGIGDSTSRLNADRSTAARTAESAVVTSSLTTANAPPRGVVPFDKVADEQLGWTDGLLGFLPYDEEYHCNVPSENPERGLAGAITAIVAYQSLEDDLPARSIYDLVRDPVAQDLTELANEADETDQAAARADEHPDLALADAAVAEQDPVEVIEPLPFLVLGYASNLTEQGPEDVRDSSQVSTDQEVVDSGRRVGVELLKGVGRSLVTCGEWLHAAAASLETAPYNTAD